MFMNIDKQEPRRIDALIKFGEWNYQFGGSVVFAYSAFIYPSGNNIWYGAGRGRENYLSSSLIHGVPGVNPPPNPGPHKSFHCLDCGNSFREEHRPEQTKENHFLQCFPFSIKKEKTSFCWGCWNDTTKSQSCLSWHSKGWSCSRSMPTH